jgi:hypothetical protein
MAFRGILGFQTAERMNEWKGLMRVFKFSAMLTKSEVVRKAHKK